MKYGFMKKFKTEFTASIKETMMVFAIMLLVSITMGLSFIMLNSDQIERSLMKNVDIKLQVNGNHILDNNNDNNDSREKMFSYKIGGETFDNFYADLKEFSLKEGVQDYNYNIGTDSTLIQYSKAMLDYTAPKYRMLGINSPTYKKNERIELSEGRFLTQEEIENGDRKVVISDRITINGEKLNVGDVISVNIVSNPFWVMDKAYADNYYSADVEIVGIYKPKMQFDPDFGKQDAFMNHDCILIPALIMEEAVIGNEKLDYNQVFVNNIWYKLENFDYYYDCYYDFFNMVSTNGARILSITGGIGNNNPAKMNVKQNTYASIMRSVDKTSNFYFVVFAVGAITSIVLLSSMMVFILNRKIREINIYYSLGQSKRNIIMKYAGYYCFIGAFAAVIGFAAAFGFSQFLFGQLVQSSGNIQFELLKLSNVSSDMSNVASVKLDGIRNAELIRSALLSFSSLILIMFMMINGSMLNILHGNMRDKINGGI